ncbi:Phage protein (N4 Gp49/phage Sf6 gene 66) family protein [Nitrosospira sp. Nsp11]|uniref:Gp49 family protein n=1 Tax=Nitrosospira sp. Nsp11 TaxID=1855338 RepID=UPI000921A143|nr:Gp49 family protein [Nitrosospira sp. Nsp11]SHL42620.1 Phage protein (N4 Gp49/phage Sf6 gene 66) family protein [Nitrosospira sp. Nsp11]
MNDAQLEQLIAATPNEKVTKESIEARIEKVDYMILPNSTVTVCNITLENGFSVRGESACVDARNFDMEIGRQIAYRDSFNRLWQLEGYLLAERRHQLLKRTFEEKSLA